MGQRPKIGSTYNIVPEIPTFEEIQEKRCGEIQEKIDNILAIKEKAGSSIYELTALQEMFKPLECYSKRQKKTIQQLEETFTFYKKIVEALNVGIKYVPSIHDYCSLLGVSKGTLNNYRNEDEEYDETISRIEDYFISFLLQTGMQGKTEQVSTIFGLKAIHGLKDSNDVIIQNNTQVIQNKNVDDILSSYKTLVVENKDKE